MHRACFCEPSFSCLFTAFYEIERVGLFEIVYARDPDVITRIFPIAKMEISGAAWKSVEMKLLQKDSEAAEGLQGTAGVPPSLIDVSLLPWTFFLGCFFSDSW